VVHAEMKGYAPEVSRIAAKSLAFCFSLWPLSVTKEFKCTEGVTLEHENWGVQVLPGTVTIGKDSPHTGVARLDLAIPPTREGLSLYAGIADDEKERKEALGGKLRVTFNTSAILQDGALFPAAWTLDLDGERKDLPKIGRKSFLFRASFALPGCYKDLQTSKSACAEIEMGLSALFQREYQGTKSSLDPPRFKVDHTALALRMCGIVDIVSDGVPKVHPLLLAEAKKDGMLQAGLKKLSYDLVHKEARLETAYETVIDWTSSGISIDGIELPVVDESVMMRAHAEVNLVRALAEVSATLSRAGGLAKEAEAVSKLKTVPSSFGALVSSCMSLIFTDKKKTAEQVGGFNAFRKEVKSGFLGRCINLNPYEIDEKIVERTQQLAKFDEKKMEADYPAAALVATWLREFLKCAAALQESSVSLRDKKMGYQSDRNFLDVASPIPALTALRAQPIEGVRVVEFVGAPGWWTLDFDSGARAAGGGAAAVKALSSSS